MFLVEKILLNYKKENLFVQYSRAAIRLKYSNTFKQLNINIFEAYTASFQRFKFLRKRLPLATQSGVWLQTTMSSNRQQSGAMELPLLSSEDMKMKRPQARYNWKLCFIYEQFSNLRTFLLFGNGEMVLMKVSSCSKKEIGKGISLWLDVFFSKNMCVHLWKFDGIWIDLFTSVWLHDCIFCFQVGSSCYHSG